MRDNPSPCSPHSAGLYAPSAPAPQDLVAMRAPTRTTTVDMLSAEELQEEAARLLKHMSIGG